MARWTRGPGWLWALGAALAASVVLNLFLAGVVSGRIGAHRAFDSVGGFDPELRAVVAEELRATRGEARAAFQALRAARRAAVEALRAEPLDLAAAQARLAETRAATAQAQAVAHAAVLRAMADAPVALRRRIPDRVIFGPPPVRRGVPRD